MKRCEVARFPGTIPPDRVVQVTARDHPLCGWLTGLLRPASSSPIRRGHPTTSTGRISARCGSPSSFGESGLAHAFVDVLTLLEEDRIVAHGAVPEAPDREGRVEHESNPGLGSSLLDPS
jgi:hypothetical protein